MTCEAHHVERVLHFRTTMAGEPHRVERVRLESAAATGCCPHAKRPRQGIVTYWRGLNAMPP